MTEERKREIRRAYARELNMASDRHLRDDYLKPMRDAGASREERLWALDDHGAERQRFRRALEAERNPGGSQGGTP